MPMWILRRIRRLGPPYRGRRRLGLLTRPDQQAVVASCPLHRICMGKICTEKPGAGWQKPPFRRTSRTLGHQGRWHYPLSWLRRATAFETRAVFCGWQKGCDRVQLIMSARLLALRKGPQSAATPRMPWLTTPSRCTVFDMMRMAQLTLPAPLLSSAPLLASQL